MKPASYKNYAREVRVIIDAIWHNPEKFEDHDVTIKLSEMASDKLLYMRFYRIGMMPVVERTREYKIDGPLDSTPVDDDYAKTKLDEFLSSHDIWAYSGNNEKAEDILAQLTNDHAQACVQIEVRYKLPGRGGCSQRMWLVGFNSEQEKILHALAIQNTELIVQDNQRPFHSHFFFETTYLRS